MDNPRTRDPHGDERQWQCELIAAKLKRILIEHPELRLGQIVVNALRLANPNFDHSTGVFMVEDEVVIEGLKELEKVLDDKEGD